MNLNIEETCIVYLRCFNTKLPAIYAAAVSTAAAVAEVFECFPVSFAVAVADPGIVVVTLVEETKQALGQPLDRCYRPPGLRSPLPLRVLGPGSFDCCAD